MPNSRGRKAASLAVIRYTEGALDLPRVTAELGAIARQREALAYRREVAQKIASEQAAAARQATVIRTYCARVARHIADLGPGDRQRLLRALIDTVILGADAIEIQGMLPGRWVPPPADHNRTDSQDVVPPRGSNLQRALGVRLAADLGEIATWGFAYVFRESPRRRGRDVPFAVEICHRVLESG
jgi:hypothetical protein